MLKFIVIVWMDLFIINKTSNNYVNIKKKNFIWALKYLKIWIKKTACFYKFINSINKK